MSLSRFAISAAVCLLRRQPHSVRCFGVQSSQRILCPVNNESLKARFYRSVHDNSANKNGETSFLHRLEPTIKQIALQKGLDKAEGTMEKLLACVRVAVSQAISGDPNENFEITDHLEGMSVPQIMLLGQLLLEAVKSLGSRCYQLAAPILRQAAMRGDINAKYSYGRMLLDGLGVDRDPEEAARVLLEVVEAGDKQTRPLALYCLGSMHTHGIGVHRDTAKAVEYFEVSAEEGVNMAYSSLGWLFLRGFGVVKNIERALTYFEKGVAKNDASSQHALADCYMNGHGVKKDASKACELYEKAVAGEHPMAMHSLGVCYSVGDGVAMDMKRTVDLWTKAAGKGLPESQINLGNLYASGRFVEKDLKKARELFSRAAFSRPEAAELLKELEKTEEEVSSDEKR